MRFARWTALPVVMLVVGLSVVWGASPAAACSCAGAPFEAFEEDWEGIESFEAVFIGVAESSEQVSSEEVRWVFEVTSVLHGEVASPISLSTPVDGGACGLDWVSEGSTIAVGVNTWRGQLSTDLCSIDRLEAVDGIGERRPPLEPGDAAAVNPGDLNLASDIIDESPTESTTSQIIVMAIGILSILGAAVFVAVLARRAD